MFHYGPHYRNVSSIYIRPNIHLSDYCHLRKSLYLQCSHLTLLGLGLIKIITVLANFNNPRPSLTLNN